MSKKRKIRELAMQVLFVWDAVGADDRESAATVVEGGGGDESARSAALAAAGGAWAQRDATDAWVNRLAPQWPPRRQPGVDRALIRLAVWEMTAGGVPPKVAIDEAIELAKQFSTENSPGFVNGVLDAVLRDLRALTDGRPPSATLPEANAAAGSETQAAAAETSRPAPESPGAAPESVSPDAESPALHAEAAGVVSASAEHRQPEPSTAP